ncbi:MAG TPA: 2-amino-4-hydroxy-6-hydroxymethyldihydropteridine diphosphokinase, partial [Jatrophihabitantaceae bacterium]|nr:2-amino-4-hydroxy-6-hydroxymethyldihydropteridine diphosphokinase [Jatrophihabitantaceae bacterium]
MPGRRAGVRRHGDRAQAAGTGLGTAQRPGRHDPPGARVSTAVLSIGSNLGDRLAHLQGAVDAMRPWLRAVSPVYETAPWGPIEQDDYLNAVL